MSCVAKQISGIIADCNANKGGIKRLWLTTTDPKPYYDESIGYITSFENLDNTEWYEYNFAKNTSSFTSTLNKDESAGTRYVSTELTLQFNKMNNVKRIEMEALSVNNMYAIVQDSNGKKWYMGYDLPITATSGTGQTGTAPSDSNNYQIVLSDESKEYLYELDPNYKFLPVIYDGIVTGSNPELPTYEKQITVYTNTNLLPNEPVDEGTVVGKIKMNEGNEYNLILTSFGSSITINVENSQIKLEGLHVNGNKLTLTNPQSEHIEAINIYNS